jgi:hypothetical protein
LIEVVEHIFPVRGAALGILMGARQIIQTNYSANYSEHVFGPGELDAVEKP